jgi:hypothetical protein
MLSSSRIGGRRPSPIIDREALAQRRGVLSLIGSTIMVVLFLIVAVVLTIIWVIGAVVVGVFVLSRDAWTNRSRRSRVVNSPVS